MTVFVIGSMLGVVPLVGFLRQHGVPLGQLASVMIAIVIGLVGSLSFLIGRQLKRERDVLLDEWLAGVSAEDRARLAEAHRVATLRLRGRFYPMGPQNIEPEDVVAEMLVELKLDR